jgi:hypothetical protein
MLCRTDRERMRSEARPRGNVIGHFADELELMVRGGSKKGDQYVLQGDHTHPKRHDFGIRHFRNLALLRHPRHGANPGGASYHPRFPTEPAHAGVARSHWADREIGLACEVLANLYELLETVSILTDTRSP